MKLKAFLEISAYPQGVAEHTNVLWRLAVFISYGGYPTQVTQVTPVAQTPGPIQFLSALTRQGIGKYPISRAHCREELGVLETVTARWAPDNTQPLCKY